MKELNWLSRAGSRNIYENVLSGLLTVSFAKINWSHNSIQGRRWVRIGGSLKQIECGPNGVCFGVNRLSHVLYRYGVSQRRPSGISWIRIGKKMKQVTVGCIGVFATNRRGGIFQYRGEYFENIYWKGSDFVFSYMLDDVMFRWLANNISLR